MYDLPPLTAPMGDHMAVAATNRATMWRCMRQAVSAPSPEFVAALRDGSWINRLLAATEWTGEGRARLLASARPLVAYEHGAQTRDAEADLADLRHGNPGDDALATRCARQAQWCLDEAGAWQSGDEEEGRRLRRRQFSDLDEGLLDALLAHIDRLMSGLHANIHLILARILTAVCALESGRNLPEPRPHVSNRN